MKFSFYFSSLVLAASVVSASVLAETPAQRLDQIVVTPARAAQLQQDVVGDISVIGPEELAQAGQSSVAELLARQPGLEFYSQGGPQTLTGVSIRGAGFNHTLVLINGMRINSSVNGGANLNAIDPASIERIEIIRGAASSLYGSDAIGGVINIITKQGSTHQEPQLYGSIGYGSYKTFKTDLGLQGSHQGLSYGFNASYARSKGFDATNKNAAFGIHYDDKDGYHSHSFSGSLAYEFKTDQTLGLNVYNSYINGDFDNGEVDWTGADVREAFTQTRQQSYDIYSRNRINSLWLSTLSLGLSKESGATPVFDSEFSTLQRHYRWQNDLELHANHQLSLLVERLEERITHNENYDADQRNTNSVAAIYRAQFGIQRLQASLRNDNISAYGNRVTGGLGYDIDITDHWTAGAAFNTGFKAPTFSQLYYPGFNNPALKAEKSRNVEAFVGYADTSRELKLTLYQNKIRDLINSTASTNFLPDNIDRATIRGLSLYGSQDFGALNVWASADFANPKDDATGKQLIRRAKRNIKAGVNYQWAQARVGAELQAASQRYDDSANSSDSRLSGYGLVNLTASYTLHKNLEAQVRWNNIFDKNYYSAYGYNMPGSNVFVNFAWRM